MNKKRLAGILAIIAGIIILTLSVLLYTDTLHIWEDGSFAFGTFPYPISGCFPWGICN